jgi:signal transduction histidine kinase
MRMMKLLVVNAVKAERAEIVEALARIEHVAVQGAVADLSSAKRALAETAPDVVVTGLEVRGGDWSELIAAAHQTSPPPSVMVVGMVEEPASAGDEALRLIGRVAAGVAHDVNNYLAIAATAATLAQRNPAALPVWHQMHTALAHASRAIRSLLEYARGEPPPLAPLDLGALVADTIHLARSALGHATRIRAEIADDLPAVRGARSELEQLVLNLVLNADEATPDGGELVVRVVATEGSTVLVEVTDAGPGIPADALAGTDGLSPSSKPARRGGLGLGIVRRVAERHGAAVRVVRHDAAAGTTVAIAFPSGVNQ